jgi:transcriptional regulator with XRE-family HTH domain
MTLSNRFGDSQRQYGVVPVVVLDIGGLLSGTHPSTATGLGMRSPTMLSDIDAFIADIETITNSAAIQDQYWRASPSTTERGTSNVGATSVAEEVRKHRDDISRRTRLTRQQIARALGVDRRSLSFWVSGSSAPGSERMERLRALAALVREIDIARPGVATEILLARHGGQDALDMIAQGRFDRAQNWRSLESMPSVRISPRGRGDRKSPLFASAFEAARTGTLHAPKRVATVRYAAEYEQDLSLAEIAFPDEMSGPRRGRLR